MSRIDWDRVWKVFDDALEAPTEQRGALLDEACGDDADLRAEVEGLLAGHDHDDGVLDRAPAGSLAATTTGAVSSSSAETSVGPYRIVREIGRGGMGVVYLAEDPRSSRQAAIKLIAPHLSAEPQARRRLLAEARAASRLEHPNICEILEVSETDDGRLFLAMPFYDGETLNARIQRGVVAVDEALAIAIQAAAGLERAHAAGVVHRDVKPSNLLLSSDGSVKILDFGVAKSQGSSLSDPGVRVGTLSYMAPEQILGEAVSAAADLWALGVTLYEMVAGRRPFQGEYEPAVMYEILNEEPPSLRSLNPAVPPGLERLLEALLEKNAGRRLGSAAELITELRALERGEEVAVGRPGPQQIPQVLTSFFGRERELEQLERVLASARLATLTGPAGSGKTRLAIEAARRFAGRYPGGVWFVSLAPAQDRAQAAALVARALGLPAGPGADVVARIEDKLRSRKALLILDTCEQVLDCGPDLARLLVACEQLTVLTASRAPLRISGERELAVGPFEPPAPGASIEQLERNNAVALFLDRARALQPGFEINDSNAAHIVELCTRLDGLPLAIELAAARIKLFSPKALLGRLSARLDLLSTKGPDRPDRHRTLRRAIECSHELLAAPERMLFRRLAVFRGGCDLSAIQRVCSDGDGGALLDSLDALLQHNLVRRIDDGHDEPRFDVLETIRDLAAERLDANDEADRIRSAHAAHYLELAEARAGSLAGPGQAETLDRFELEFGNLQTALDWAVETASTELGLRLAVAMWRFWLARGRIEEGARRFEALLALDTRGLDPRLLAEALHDQATLEQNRGRNARAAEILNRCLEIWRSLDDERGVANALANQAWVDCELSRLDEAEALSHEALELHHKLGARRGEAVDWNNLGWAAAYRGRPREAIERFAKSLDLRRQAGDQRGEAFALASMAWAEGLRGRFAEAHRLLDQSSRRLLRIGDRVLLGFSLVGRATVLLDEGRLAEAHEIAEKAQREWDRGGNRSGEAWTLTLRGEILVERGELEAAIGFLEQGRHIWTLIGGQWGDAMTAAAQARAFQATERFGEARAALRSSLETRLRIGDRRGLAECLEIAAAFEAEAQPEQAARLAALAAAARRALDTPRPRRRLDARIPTTSPMEIDPPSLADSIDTEAVAALSRIG